MLKKYKLQANIWIAMFVEYQIVYMEITIWITFFNIPIILDKYNIYLLN